MSEEQQTIRWFSLRFRFVGNDGSIVWAGHLSVPPGFGLDTEWYHCPTCLDSDGFERGRLSIGARFCPGCGATLDWGHTGEWEPDDVTALQAEIARATGQRVTFVGSSSGEGE